MTGPVIWTVDIETRPSEVYTWGMFNQNHSLSQLITPGGLMMFAAKRYGEKGVEAHCEWDDRAAMVARSHAIYDEADYIISYNGVGFDTKHLKAEWVQAGLAPPAPWRELDLLKVARKLNLPSRKLSYLCGALGLDLKTDPGGMETWHQIIRGEGDVQLKAQKRMVKYCKNDVKITEQLFDRLKPWVEGLNVPLYSVSDSDADSTVAACTRCNSTQIQSRGWAYTTTLRYRRFQCQACGGWMKSAKSEPTPTEMRNA